MEFCHVFRKVGNDYKTFTKQFGKKGKDNKTNKEIKNINIENFFKFWKTSKHKNITKNSSEKDNIKYFEAM
jgi:hypothetical protein